MYILYKCSQYSALCTKQHTQRSLFQSLLLIYTIQNALSAFYLQTKKTSMPNKQNDTHVFGVVNIWLKRGNVIQIRRLESAQQKATHTNKLSTAAKSEPIIPASKHVTWGGRKGEAFNRHTRAHTQPKPTDTRKARDQRQ